MSDEKRQKVMIGVLAVLVLGAGGYWFVLRDSGAGDRASDVNTGVERKKREKKGDSNKTTKRATRDKGKKTTERAERKERVRTERDTTRKKRRSKGKAKVKKKKKELPPAACLPPVDDWLEEFDPSSFRPRFV